MVYKNRQLQQNPCYSNHMEGRIHNQDPSKMVSASTISAFGNGFSNTAVSSYPGGRLAGEKRNSSGSGSGSVEGDGAAAEAVDCHQLRSSLKRVRLCRSPGEFRLQRDLKSLHAMQWGSSHYTANAINFASTTWIHRSTGARLTMVDSLCVCLYLPMTAVEQPYNNNNNNNNNNTDPNQNPQQHYYRHQLHSYHRDYRWRLMIKFPRMYPHRPPEVTRIEGLSLDGIGINDAPPYAGWGNENGAHETATATDGLSPSVCSSSGIPTSESRSPSLFFTESRLARYPNTITTTQNNNNNNNNNTQLVNGNGKNTIEWNEWSPITRLGELLDFLLMAAAANLSSATTTATTKTEQTTTTPMNATNYPFMMKTTRDTVQPSTTVTTSRLASTSTSSLSSVSSASTISSWHNNNNDNNNNSSHDNGMRRGIYNNNNNNNNNFVAETIMSDENETTTSIRTNISGASFLSPNRFDVGYGKSVSGRQQQQQHHHHHHHHRGLGTTPQTANTTAWQRHREKEEHGDDDTGMDMS